jgi:hypothetical protein
MNMPTRQEVVDLAKAEMALNVREDVAEDQDSGGHIARYWSAVGDIRSAHLKEEVLDGVRGRAWCAAFVSYVFKNAGRPIGPGFAYVPYLKGWLQDVGQYRDSDYEPDPGDLILFKGSSRPNHVGIVAEVANGFAYTIEGNLSDGLRSRAVRMDRQDIDGYGVLLHE